MSKLETPPVVITEMKIFERLETTKNNEIFIPILEKGRLSLHIPKAALA